MKNQLIVLLSLGLASSALAANEFVPFTTPEQAQLYCPATTELTFTSIIPSNPKSVGTISGNHGVVFESIPAKTAIHPKNLNTSGFISDAQFRSAEGMYGYISNNVTTCLYSYTTVFDTQYALVLRGK